MIESDSTDVVQEQPPGTRFYLISYVDGETGLRVAAATSMDLEDLAEVDRVCEMVGVPFSMALPRAAFKHLAARAWDDGVAPEGTEIQTVTEVSRRELLSFMESHERKATEEEAS